MAASEISEAELDQLLACNCVYKTTKAYCFMFTNTMYQMHLNFAAALIEATLLARKEMSN